MTPTLHARDPLVVLLGAILAHRYPRSLFHPCQLDPASPAFLTRVVPLVALAVIPAVLAVILAVLEVLVVTPIPLAARLAVILAVLRAVPRASLPVACLRYQPPRGAPKCVP